MTRPATVTATELPPATWLPGALECVVAVWRDDAPRVVVRLRQNEQLIVGRANRTEVMSVNKRTFRVSLAAERPFLSRDHLVVDNTADAGVVRVLDGVRNPGRARIWGDLHWRTTSAGAHLDSRHGLLAVLLPDRPPWVLTITWGPRARRRQETGAVDSRITVAESSVRGIDMSPAQRDAVVVALMDAVRWPPPPGGGGVRSWTALPNGDAHRMAYNRLCRTAAESTDLPWTDSGQRGADPALLTALIESESLDYATVQRQYPWRPGISGGLIPTHHT